MKQGNGVSQSRDLAPMEGCPEAQSFRKAFRAWGLRLTKNRCRTRGSQTQLCFLAAKVPKQSATFRFPACDWYGKATLLGLNVSMCVCALVQSSIHKIPWKSGVLDHP